MNEKHNTEKIFIEEIKIKNFRSIRNITLNLQRANIFVGKNDSGKSNILRALNLFFNGETDVERKFNLELDINRDILEDKNYKSAKEVMVELKIKLPQSYWKNNGEYLIWRKQWRRDRFIESLNGLKKIKSRRREKDKYIKIDIPQKSNVLTLINRINFLYVPVIKDRDYFKSLLRDLYSTISHIAETEFKNSRRDFEKSIMMHLNNLTEDIKRSIGVNSTLSLPRDLGDIFSSLEFIDDNNIPLESRGDGIKTRHIASILKFISKGISESRKSKGIPYSFLWGYEEPENSLEFSFSLDLAKYLTNMLEDGDIAQIFITTHSPIYYNLEKKLPYAKTFYITRITETLCTSEEKTNLIDHEIGTIQIIAPYIEQAQSEIEQLNKNINELKNSQSEINHHCIYVEGQTDKIFFDYLISTLHPDQYQNIKIISGNGAEFVKNKLIARESYYRSSNEYKQALGIFDNDTRGLKCKKEYEDIISAYFNSKKKCTSSIKLVRPYFDEIELDGYIFKYNDSCEVEDLYDFDSWLAAYKNKWLVERKITEIAEQFISKKHPLNERIRFVSTLTQHLEKLVSIIESHKIHPSLFFKCKDEFKVDFAKLAIKNNFDEILNNNTKIVGQIDDFVKKTR